LKESLADILPFHIVQSARIREWYYFREFLDFKRRRSYSIKNREALTLPSTSINPVLLLIFDMNMALMYYLRKPVPGLWSSNVLSRFHYFTTEVVGNCPLGLQAVEYLFE
jgi:hypothetical protein